MPTVYPGNASAVVLADPVELTIPAGGDSLTAASVNTGGFEPTADQLALIRQSVYGGATDLVTLFRSTTTPTINKLIGEWNITGTVKGRMYACNDYFIGVVRTVNAEYTGNVGAEWKTDINAPAILINEETTGTNFYGRAATAPAAPWANAGWTSTQFLSRTGAITAATDLVATAGSVQATVGDVTAGQDVIATRALQANQSQFTSVYPGTGTINPGRGFKGMIPFAAAQVTVVAAPGAQTLDRSANISTVVRTATVGEFDVTLLSGVNYGAGERLIPNVVVYDNGAGMYYISNTAAPTGTTFRIQFTDAAGANADPLGFYLTVLGG